jgi:hypothetical protein
MKLRNAKQLEGHALRARDGAIGQVKDFYFDDHHWHVRYCVVETGQWLKSRRVLISPAVLGAFDSGLKTFAVDLTTDQVRNSPDVDTDKPVSRQHEEELRQYYGWPAYWGGSFYGGGLTAPIIPPTPAANSAEPGLTDGDRPLTTKSDPHLRSVNDTIGYNIEAIDGAIGHVDDFLIDEEDWSIRYLAVDTRNWWPGKKVVIAPSWISNVSWTKSQVVVDLTREAIKGSPAYDPSTPWNPAYATELHDYYGRPRYGAHDPAHATGESTRREES